MQAARGASLNLGADVRPRPGDPRLRLVFAAVFLAAYAVDVVSKIVAVDTLSGREDIQLVGDWFQLHLTRNPGAAFSTAETLTPVLSLLAVGASGVVLYVARRLGSRLWAVSLGLLLAGILGNLTDRVFREPAPLQGHVVDFFMLPNWPVFNVADICINVGAGLALLASFRGIAVDGARLDREPKTPVPQDPTE
jgi:signal peptidase II